MTNVDKILGIQGDLLFFRVDTIPAKAKKRKTNVILEGESTGNAHRLSDGNVYEDGLDLYLETYIPTRIIHEEHLPDPLEVPGKVKVYRQREYSSQNMTRLVMD